MSGAEKHMNEAVASVASSLAIVAAEVSATTGVGYAEALDMLMRAAGYVPPDESITSHSVHEAAVRAVLELCDEVRDDAVAHRDGNVIGFIDDIRAAITGAGTSS